MPATVSGSRFIVNHVPLTLGSNTISTTAMDANGLTTTTTRSITASTGNYIRISSNIDSGTGPLNISLRLDGSFSIASPQMSYSGPVPVTLTPGASSTEYTATLTAEGPYTFTASATAPDGQTYSDSLTVTVVPRYQLEMQLQNKWAGIRSKFTQGDVEGAVSYLVSYRQALYRQIFTGFGPRLPSLADDTATLKLVYSTNGLVKCILIRQEDVLGTQKSVAYPVYYSKENGTWKLQKY